VEAQKDDQARNKDSVIPQECLLVQKENDPINGENNESDYHFIIINQKMM
jgi:hypothetical protein